jgi:hypothetical protein
MSKGKGQDKDKGPPDKARPPLPPLIVPPCSAAAAESDAPPPPPRQQWAARPPPPLKYQCLVAQTDKTTATPTKAKAAAERRSFLEPLVGGDGDEAGGPSAFVACSGKRVSVVCKRLAAAMTAADAPPPLVVAPPLKTLLAPLVEDYLPVAAPPKRDGRKQPPFETTGEDDGAEVDTDDDDLPVEVLGDEREAGFEGDDEYSPGTARAEGCTARRFPQQGAWEEVKKDDAEGKEDGDDDENDQPPPSHQTEGPSEASDFEEEFTPQNSSVPILFTDISNDDDEPTPKRLDDEYMDYSTILATPTPLEDYGSNSEDEDEEETPLKHSTSIFPDKDNVLDADTLQELGITQDPQLKFPFLY